MSWISSTVAARPIFWHWSSTDSAMRWICTGVMRSASSTESLALVTATMIFVMSKISSEPFRLMIFISLSSSALGANIYLLYV